MPTRIVIASYPRSGSTYLCSKLARLNAVKMYLEIFHFSEDVVRQHMSGDWERIKERLVDSGWSGESFFSEYKARPDKFLEALERMNTPKVVAFKVFPGHLDADGLAQCLDDSIPVILYRDIVDAYISDEIAARTKKYGNHDTSSELVSFDCERFLVFGRRVARHLAYVMENCAAKSIDPMLVTYDEIVDPEFVDIMRDRIGVRLGWDPGVTNENVDEPKRQDRRSSRTDKVMNPGEMEEHLTRLEYDRNLAQMTDNDMSALRRGLEAVFNDGAK